MKLSGTKISYESFSDNIIADQFPLKCHSKWAVYQKEKKNHYFESLSGNTTRDVNSHRKIHLKT